MVIIVFGLPGTGKSFFARHMAGETGAVYLGTDVIRKKLHKRGEYDKKAKQEVYEHMLKEMAAQIALGNDVIVDGTFHKKERRDWFGEKIRDAGLDPVFIEMKAGEGTIKDRLQSTREFSEADQKVYLQIKKSFEPMQEPHLVLWSDELDLHEMIDKAKHYLNGKRTSRNSAQELRFP